MKIPAKVLKNLTITFLILLLSGCVSIKSLPQSSSEANFNPEKEGRTGWSKYEEVFFFKGVDKRTAYLAAKAGLADAGFTIKRASYKKLFAIGEYGMTAYDWNIVAGVYVKPEEPEGCWVKVHVKGSKDVGFWGDMTASSWTQDIFKGMRNYILTESQITDPKKKHFK